MEQPDPLEIRRYRAWLVAADMAMCAVPFAAWLLLHLDWNWAFFVLQPALIGMGMLCEARTLRVTWAYSTLAGVWLAAAALGALSHWDQLSPVTVWLSLARYVLIAIAYTAGVLPIAFSWPVFSERARARRMTWWRRLGGLFALAVWLALVGVMVYLAPLPLSLTPGYPGARYRRVLAAPQCDEVRGVAFSPDGQKLLVQVSVDISLVRLNGGESAQVITKGALASQNPWLPSGEAFVLVRDTGEDGGVWVTSEDGRYQRKVVGGADIGGVACSPDGGHIAFRQRGVGVVVMTLDGVSRQVIAKHGGNPRWSPDGKRILFERWEGDGDRSVGSFWVTTPDGQARKLSIPWSQWEEVAWLRDDAVVISHCSASTFDADMVKPAVTVDIYSLGGNRVKRFQFDTLLGLLPAQPVASPDGRSLAVSPGTGLPSLACPSRPFVLDVKTGRVLRLPVPGDALCADWSSDGRSLAVIEALGPAMLFEEQQQGPRVGVVSGL